MFVKHNHDFYLGNCILFLVKVHNKYLFEGTYKGLTKYKNQN